MLFYPTCTTTRLPGKHPPKPLSAYNIYFCIESKRLQERRRCREKYFAIVGQTGEQDKRLNGFSKRKNATLSVIGKRWKDYEEKTRLYFEEQGRERLKEYFDLLAVSNAEEMLLILRGRKALILRALNAALTKCYQKDVVQKEIVWLLE